MSKLFSLATAMVALVSLLPGGSWGCDVGGGGLDDGSAADTAAPIVHFITPRDGDVLGERLDYGSVKVLAFDVDSGSQNGDGIDYVEMVVADAATGDIVTEDLEFWPSYDFGPELPDGTYVLVATAHPAAEAGTEPTTTSITLTIETGDAPGAERLATGREPDRGERRAAPWSSRAAVPPVALAPPVAATPTVVASPTPTASAPTASVTDTTAPVAPTAAPVVPTPVPVVPTPLPPPATSAPAAPAPVTPSGAGQAASLAAINQVRANVGLPPLALNGSMSTFAQQWSQQMASSGFGHSGGPYGENVAWYSDSSLTADAAAAFFNGRWVNSPGHYANMISDRYTEIGIGLYRDANGWWATHVFR